MDKLLELLQQIVEDAGIALKSFNQGTPVQTVRSLDLIYS